MYIYINIHTGVIKKSFFNNNFIIISTENRVEFFYESLFR